MLRSSSTLATSTASCAPRSRMHARSTQSVVPKRNISTKSFPEFTFPWPLPWLKPNSTSTANTSTTTTPTPSREVAEAVRELNKDALERSLKYGVFARLAYEDTDTAVRAGLANYLDGKYKDVQYKKVVQKGTLWKTPITGFTMTTDTELLALRLPSEIEGEADEMVIAFRGTETSGTGALQDILTDAYALQEYIGDMEGVPSDKYPKGVMVHRGFLRSFNDVIELTADGKYDALTTVRDELMGKGVVPKKVVVCGHSLGAALATLGAFWVKTMMPEVDVHCYAYASPRVGNKEWSKIFSKTVDNCNRYIHKNDVVPAVPASSMWDHVEDEVFLIEPKKGCYGLCVNPDQASGAKYKALWAKRPRDGKYLSVNDHSMDLYLGAISDCLKHCKC